MAYDVAAIEYRGLNAVTNFDISRYIKWHHRCHPAYASDGLNATTKISGHLLDELTSEHPTIDLDEAMVAAFHDGELQDQSADNHFAAQLPQGGPLPHAASESTLSLLLQSPKFKEMIERAAASESSTGSPSSSSPLPPPTQQQQPEYSDGTSSARCSFPDDVQTYFGCDDGGGGFDYAEVDTFLFGDLGAYAAPIFQCELDV